MVTPGITLLEFLPEDQIWQDAVDAGNLETHVSRIPRLSPFPLGMTKQTITLSSLIYLAANLRRLSL